MKFQLTSYQTDAASEVTGALMEGLSRFEKSGRLTAVSLSAPTGAGKTVIATAVIEELLFGSDVTEPNPDTTVLWVTDDPSLNQQTKRKMLLSSSMITPAQLVTVDQTLDQKVLDRGKVYFVHIQQLGKGATNYVRTGNKRQYSLWDTVGETIASRGNDFLIIVDEAHKGTAVRNGGGKTITAQLIDGAGGAFPPTPVVLGISATPERFVEAIAKAGQRTLEPIGVDVDAVRESGLIKDKIRIRHPTESQAGDSTLLELAVTDLKAFDELWARYSEQQGEPLVSPALVIQVKAMVSDSELKESLETLSRAWNILDGKAIGHSFQEHSTLNLGTRSVRYVAPQDIQDDAFLRVVLFKEALTTGWDCPRAEVMLSFRSAQDYTYIAQLIGRMVRTPLARRIATDDVLNTVALYLPYYNEAQVAQVVAGLESDESILTSTTEIDSITCPKNPKVPQAVWDCLDLLPTYTRPGKYHRNEVSRLNALAALLVGNALDSGAMDTARQHLIDTLDREAVRLGAELDKKTSEFRHLQYLTQTVDLASGSVDKEASVVDINPQNIDDLFRRARRLLGDAAAKWYWNELCDSGTEADEAKVRVAALADDPSVPAALESSAHTLIDTWRSQHNGAIGNLPDAKRALFYNIWQQARRPEQIAIIMPSQITAADRGTKWPKHIYANGKHLFPATFTGWEKDVLDTELGRDGIIAWYRNPTGGTAALAVPYEQSGTHRTMYPDFVFFHEEDGAIVADLVDPHRPDSADTGPKWSGLAEYAVRHSKDVRRVLAVIKSADGQLLSLDLRNPDVAIELGKANNETDIRAIFAEYGGAY